MRQHTALLTLLPVLLNSAPAQAIGVRAGAEVPYFQVRDLTERLRTSREFAGRRTLVVAIASPDAGDAMHVWLTTMERHVPPGSVRIIALLALDLPFYAPWGLVAGMAREQVPAEHWADTWLDRGGVLQRVLGLDPHSHRPYVFVLDAQGQVVTLIHGPMGGGNTTSIGSALIER